MTGLGRLFALLILAPSLAGAAPPVATDPPPEKERKICREAERQTGSHIRTPRKCRTAREWQEHDQARALPLSAQVTEGQGDVGQAQRPQ
jgi:hypothetical protein